jgi:hypothetical protein
MELVKELNPFSIKLEIVDHFSLESDLVFDFSATLGTHACQYPIGFHPANVLL